MYEHHNNSWRAGAKAFSYGVICNYIPTGDVNDLFTGESYPTIRLMCA